MSGFVPPAPPHVTAVFVAAPFRSAIARITSARSSMSMSQPTFCWTICGFSCSSSLSMMVVRPLESVRPFWMVPMASTRANSP